MIEVAWAGLAGQLWVGTGKRLCSLFQIGRWSSSQVADHKRRNSLANLIATVLFP